MAPSRLSCNYCKKDHIDRINPHTPTVVQGGGGWMEPLPRVFDMMQYFETILPSVESF